MVPEGDKWKIQTNLYWEKLLKSCLLRDYKEEGLVIDDSIIPCSERIDGALSNFYRVKCFVIGWNPQHFHYVCLACLGVNRSNLPLDLEVMDEHNSSFHGPGRKSVNKFNLDLGVVSQLEYTNASFYFAVDLKSDIIKKVFPMETEDFITDAKIRHYINDKIRQDLCYNQFKVYLKLIEGKNYFNKFMSIKNASDMYRCIEEDESIKYYFWNIISFRITSDIENAKLAQKLKFPDKSYQFFYRLEFCLPNRLMYYVGDFLKKMFHNVHSSDQFFI